MIKYGTIVLIEKNGGVKIAKEKREKRKKEKSRKQTGHTVSDPEQDRCLHYRGYGSDRCTGSSGGLQPADQSQQHRVAAGF